MNDLTSCHARDKKSFPVFAFTVVQTAALTCQICSKIFSELIDSESLDLHACVFACMHPPAHSSCSNMTVMVKQHPLQSSRAAVNMQLLLLAVPSVVGDLYFVTLCSNCILIYSF